MIAIITDRTGIAKQIAQALTIEATTGNEGSFQGCGFTLVWTDGELISLSPPEDYGKTRFTKEDLPFIPKMFTLAVRKRKAAKGRLTGKAAVKKLDAVRKVFDECESILVATDPWEDGELLFRRIYTYLECKKPFKRLWINSLTLKSIHEGFNNPAESFLFDNLYAAAGCREKADYLLNFNAGSAFSLATGLTGYPLGRTLTPALAILCKRYVEHRKFISTRFFEHCITLEKDGLFLRFVLPCTMKSRWKAEKIYEYLKTLPAAQITKVETRNRIQPSPMLYDLIALQKDANERYGLSAAQTGDIAKELYERRLISHPLADSRCIPEDVFETMPKILRQTAAYCNMQDRLDSTGRENPNRRSITKENAQPAKHHALIPAGIYPGYLPKDEACRKGTACISVSSAMNLVATMSDSTYMPTANGMINSPVK
jgi:DNA topoisomerase-3